MVDNIDKPAPQWLLHEIADGLQRLMLLSLPGTPAAETIEGTARAWTDAFWYSPIGWQQDLDASRISQAFKVIGHQVERFPSPKLVLKYMPKRPAPVQLEAPEITPAQSEENRKKLADIVASLGR